MHFIDSDPRRHPAEPSFRDAHHTLPSHSSEAQQVGGYAENVPWSAQNPSARRSDPRLGPDAGPLYGKSSAQYGQSVMSATPPDTAASLPVTWTTGSETPAPPGSTGTGQLSAVTPGLFAIMIVASHW